MKPLSLLPFLLGFTALFTCYHAAEYMVLYMNSPIGFLCLSVLFFIVAMVIARWQGYKGLAAWGMSFQKNNLIFLMAGLLAGLTVNTISFLVSLALNKEMVSFIPGIQQFIPQASLLIFGCAFSSLTEDVLTRGYLYRHLNGRISTGLLVLISALVYVLNHVHRLDEPVYLLFLLVLGIQLIIPLVICKNLWYTLGVHWAGNIVYHVTNNVMHTEATPGSNGSMWIAIVFMALLIPINYFICRQLVRPGILKHPTPYRHSSPAFRHSSELV
ncbi:MAG TPA: CPBP family intramembrane glutamic endopeptidase [Flavisolibacter sp.]|nr:CPBP family intramembrane glutamic endopeptidase [Flavisolibacter sp.]